MEWFRENDENRRLYGEASAFGASEIVLESKIGTEAFLATKRGKHFTNPLNDFIS
jgi:hypothetical protein